MINIGMKESVLKGVPDHVPDNVPDDPISE